MLLKHLSMRIKTGCTAFFILLLVVALKNFNESEAITCDSSFIVYKDDVYVKLFIKYYIFSDDGFVNLNGSIFKSDKFVQDISLKVRFNYTRKGNSFYLHSTNIESSLLNDLDLNAIKNYLPQFYLKSNINWSIGVLKQNSEYFLFFSNSTPSFLCFNRS